MSHKSSQFNFFKSQARILRIIPCQHSLDSLDYMNVGVTSGLSTNLNFLISKHLQQSMKISTNDSKGLFGDQQIAIVRGYATFFFRFLKIILKSKSESI